MRGGAGHAHDPGFALAALAPTPGYVLAKRNGPAGAAQYGPMTTARAPHSMMPPVNAAKDLKDYEESQRRENSRQYSPCRRGNRHGKGIRNDVRGPVRRRDGRGPETDAHERCARRAGMGAECHAGAWLTPGISPRFITFHNLSDAGQRWPRLESTVATGRSSRTRRRTEVRDAVGD